MMLRFQSLGSHRDESSEEEGEDSEFSSVCEVASFWTTIVIIVIAWSSVVPISVVLLYLSAANDSVMLF